MEEIALAIEHMKVDQLTKLQAHTEAQRQAYALVGRAAIELNKVLLRKLHALEHSVCYSEGIAVAHDKVAELTLFASREMEKLAKEWTMQCNGDDPTKNPRLVGVIAGLYVGKGTVDYNTGFDRNG